MLHRTILQSLLYIGIVLFPGWAAAEEVTFSSTPDSVSPVQSEEEPTFLLQEEELTETGPSSVLFLPGIKGTRLYDGDGRKLWEPFGDEDIENLMLDASGKSIRADIHMRPRDIVDTVAHITDIYDSLIEFMDDLEERGVIDLWVPYTYDWRLSLSDIVNAEPQWVRPWLQSIDETPYMHRLLKEMALTSKSGRVTIVAHSNGGLVAKELMRQLGETESARLIDKVIFIGVPQSGAPHALGALLYGYKEGIPGIISTEAARTFALNAPMGYHLLPSAAHFAHTTDTDPVVQFNATRSYRKELDAYGLTLDSFEELRAFALAEEGGRAVPNPNAVDQAAVLNERLLTYANQVHAAIDSWTPPNGITVYQIAGWGAPTISGITYFEQCLFSLCKEKYRPTFTHDGDGVVPITSALMMPETDAVKKYSLNLEEYGFSFIGKKNHGNLLTVSEVLDVIQSILVEDDTLPAHLYEGELRKSADATIRFFLHSPLTLEIYDPENRKTGLNLSGVQSEEIPGVEYGLFGEVQYLIAPLDSDYRIELHGYETGTFTLEVQKVENDVVTDHITFAEIETKNGTHVTLQVESMLETVADLQVDHDGDGTVDEMISGTHGVVLPTETFESNPLPSRSRSSDGSRSAVTPTSPTLEELQLELYSLLLQFLVQCLEREMQSCSLQPYEHIF